MLRDNSETPNKTERGLIIVFTGDGKGKTTAALGTALRAAGQGMKTLIIQFIKSEFGGEHRACNFLSHYVKIIQFGKGFVFPEKGGIEEHQAMAQQGLKKAEEEISSSRYDIVVLDEIFVALSLGLLELNDLLPLISKKPPGLHLILTGRNAPKEIIDLADTVSEVKEIKHAYKRGVSAQKGIEY